eukprot:COSAG06_NODE_10156_length_1738_cov_4.849908_1_plen_236_part_00
MAARGAAAIIKDFRRPSFPFFFLRRWCARSHSPRIALERLECPGDDVRHYRGRRVHAGSCVLDGRPHRPDHDVDVAVISLVEAGAQRPQCLDSGTVVCLRVRRQTGHGALPARPQLARQARGLHPLLPRAKSWRIRQQVARRLTVARHAHPIACSPAKTHHVFHALCLDPVVVLAELFHVPRHAPGHRLLVAGGRAPRHPALNNLLAVKAQRVWGAQPASPDTTACTNWPRIGGG